MDKKILINKICKWFEKAHKELPDIPMGILIKAVCKIHLEKAKKKEDLKSKERDKRVQFNDKLRRKWEEKVFYYNVGRK